MNKKVWVSITQPNAAVAAQNMYSGNSYIESDLINSYSWDTAIVFIQKYSGNTNYANQNSANRVLANTGMTGDKVCNIYDMASNCREWTTEHFEQIGNQCVHRGGDYGSTQTTPSYRTSRKVTDIYANVSFRLLLYIQ